MIEPHCADTSECICRPVLITSSRLPQAISARMAKYLSDLDKSARAAVDSRLLGAASGAAGIQGGGGRAQGAVGGAAGGTWQVSEREETADGVFATPVRSLLSGLRALGSGDLSPFVTRRRRYLASP